MKDESGVQTLSRLERRTLLQLRVLGFGLLEDRDVGVGILPEREKVLVRGIGIGSVALNGISSSQLQMRQCAYGVADNDPSMIENFLEFLDSFCALMCDQIGLATHIHRIERPEIPMDAAFRHS